LRSINSKSGQGFCDEKKNHPIEINISPEDSVQFPWVRCETSKLQYCESSSSATRATNRTTGSDEDPVYLAKETSNGAIP
jgi:hypothetical protein